MRKHHSLPVLIAALTLNTSFAGSLNSKLETSLENRNSRFGTIGFDTSSFLYKSKARSNTTTTVQAHFRSQSSEANNSLFKTKLDLDLYTFVADKPELGFEAPELYIATNTGLSSGFGELTIGRKKIEWSKVDASWDMMSLWSPRFTWDQAHPDTIGMTGLFYEYNSDHFKLTAFGSPLAIPERGTAVKEENGNITSSNPFWSPLPTEMSVLGVNTKLEYSLVTPSMKDILLRPNFAIKGMYDFGGGFWASANVGVLPVHIIQMAAEPYLDSATTGNLKINIRPQFPLRNIYTGEFGYQDRNNEWSLWFSTSYEQPFQFENESTWLNPIITPTSLVSAGTKIELTQNFTFEGSALFIHEQPFSRKGSLPDVSVELPTRFPVKQGFKIGGNLRFDENTASNLAWTQDLLEQNHFISADVQHLIRNSGILIGAGADIFVNQTAKGWVGQYYGNDRVRGWLKYAF